MALQLPPAFNQLNAPKIENARQNKEWNVLRNEAQGMQNKETQRQFSEEERLDNTRALAGMGKFGMDLMEKDPQSYVGFMPKIFEEFERRGLPRPQFDYTVASPEEVYAGLEEMHRQGMLGLAGEEQFEDVEAGELPAGQRSTITGKISAVGATAKGPSAPMQNFSERQRLVAKFGEDSDQVRTFDNYVRSSKVSTVAGVPTVVSPGGERPLSTQEEELSFTEREAGAKESGGRTGRPSDAQIEIDKKYAPEYLAFTQGGYQDAVKGIEQLQEVQTTLQQEDADLSGWEVATQPDFLLASTNPEALQAREQVEEVVQRNLRLILGAQFTEKEGIRLIARAYNPWIDEKYNAIRINRLMKQMQTAVEAKIAAAQHYESNETLQGFTAKLDYTMNDFHDVLSDTNPLTVGDTLNGYTYVGGDPNDRSSWQQNE